MNFNHVALHTGTDNHVISSSTLMLKRLKQAGIVRNSLVVDRMYFSKWKEVQSDQGLKKLLLCSEFQTEQNLPQKYTVRSSLKEYNIRNAIMKYFYTSYILVLK